MVGQKRVKTSGGLWKKEHVADIQTGDVNLSVNGFVRFKD